MITCDWEDEQYENVQICLTQEGEPYNALTNQVMNLLSSINCLKVTSCDNCKHKQLEQCKMELADHLYKWTGNDDHLKNWYLACRIMSLVTILRH